jgi:transcription elongation factor SPT6
LEEDDLRLVEENTGRSFKKNRRLSRFRDRNSGSPPTASTSKRHVESSEDDLDNDEELRQAPDITNIWDDERRDDDDEDMSDFIDYSDDEEGGVTMNEEAREARRQEKRQEQMLRKKARGARPELAGIDAKYVVFLCAKSY